MATPRFAWGIDIGNRALKAIKLVRDGDQLRVDDFDVIEHETVLSNSGDNRDTYINAAITQFVAKHPIKGGAVSVGVSGQSSFARFIKLPPVEAKKIPEIVRFEAIQQIPFPLDDVEWSYQLFSAPDSPDVEVGIFAMRKELINQHIKFFTDADLNVQVVQMNPLAVYNAMSYDQRVEGTTMIIDLGAENTDLIIADADTIWLRSIPIGGNNFTETLVKSFKLNFAKAEDLKRNAATSKYARQIFQAMRPVFADLVAEVQRSIGFYASVHRDSRIKKIVAVGGTFKLPGLQKYLQQNLQLEVERLDTFGAGAPPDAKQAANYQDNILSLVGSYGLALQAMGEGKVTSSLLPQRIRRERMWQEKTKFFGAAAALFVLGTGIGYSSILVNEVSYDKGEEARGKIQQVQGQAAALDTQWNDISQKGGADRQRILNIRSLTDHRDLYLQILHDIHKTLPPQSADPAQLKQVPRKDRKQVLVDTINSFYFSDLAQVGGDLKRFQSDQVQGIMPMGFMGGFSAANLMQPGMMGGPGIEMTDGGVAPSPMPQDAGAPAPEGGVAPAFTGRGYVVRIAGTTPNAAAAPLIDDTLVKGLMALTKDKIANGKPFAIEKVEIVHLRPLRENQNRVQKIKTDFESAVRAKETGTFTASTSSYSPGYGSPYGATPLDAMEGGGGYAPPMINYGDTGAAQTADAAAMEAKAYADRQFPDEDIRDDQEFVAVAVVLLDPPPKAPTDPAAPPADGAAPPANGAAPATPAPAAAPAAPPATPATPEAPAPAPATPALPAEAPPTPPPAATPAPAPTPAQ